MLDKVFNSSYFSAIGILFEKKNDIKNYLILAQ